MTTLTEISAANRLEKPTSNTNNERKTFLNLNDDCQIMICCKLSLDNLCSIAQSCAHLLSVSRNAFVLNRKNKRLNLLELVRSFGPKVESDVVLKKVENILKHFGDLIVEVVLDFTNENREQLFSYEHMKQPIFRLIVKHCSNGNLESFRASYLSVGSQAKKLFRNLKTIRLEYCQKYEVALSKNKKCTNLTIDGENGCGIFIYEFPKLESLALRFESNDCQIFSNSCNLCLLFHTNLRILKLDVTSGFTHHLNTIAKLKQLEVLKVYEEDSKTYKFITENDFLNRTKFDFLIELPKLKTLVWDCETTKFPISVESPVMQTLEYLAIYHTDSSIFDILANFKQLGVLKLNDCAGMSDENMMKLRLNKLTHLILEDINGRDLTVECLVDIVDRLQNLRKISLWLTDFVIDSQTYMKLVQICRNQNRKLDITIIDGWCPVDYIQYDTNVVKVIYQEIEDFKFRKPKIRRYKHSYIK